MKRQLLTTSRPLFTSPTGTAAMVAVLTVAIQATSATGRQDCGEQRRGGDHEEDRNERDGIRTAHAEWEQPLVGIGWRESPIGRLANAIWRL